MTRPCRHHVRLEAIPHRRVLKSFGDIAWQARRDAGNRPHLDDLTSVSDCDYLAYAVPEGSRANNRDTVAGWILNSRAAIASVKLRNPALASPVAP